MQRPGVLPAGRKTRRPLASRSLWAWGVFALSAGGLVACAPDPEVRVAGLTLRLPAAVDCRPTQPITEVVVEALGDFPASDARTIELLRPGPPQSIERFPSDTRIVTFRARAPRWEGLAARDADAGDGELVLLPEDRSCPSPDPALALEDGGEAAALPQGGLVIAGGRDGSLGSRRLVTLAPGAPLAVVRAGLDQRRLGHRIVVSGGRILVVGGALGDTGPAHDTWETFDLDGSPLGGGRLVLPRRDFGAAVLPDGRVLLVGGRTSGGGPPIDAAEIIDPIRGTSARIDPLPEPRAAPWVHVLDDGAVVVGGGRDAEGTGLRSVALFDQATATFEPAGVALAPWRESEAVPLPGARLAVVGRPFDPPTLVLLHARTDGLGRTTLVAEDVAGGISALDEARLAALPDGRLLLVGALAGMGPRAHRIDPARGTTEALEASRVPARLVGMADGTLAELAASGASFRRPTLRTRYSSPPATLLADDFALGGPGQWSADGVALVAERADARADLATLRFGDFDLELVIEGDVDVLLGARLAPPIAVRARADEIGPPLCTVPRADGGPVRITRRGARLALETPEGSRACVVDGLGDHVSVGFRASGAGARISAVQLRRVGADE
ncbi:MAG: hypothetical protein KF901_24365 [Myxococcales bacterium]|nr:hypothetical protein [Myxococcales bacterium]